MIKIIFVNFITLLRGASVFLLPYLLSTHYLIALFWVAGFALTDMLDGYLARKWKAETLFGTIFDPFADKLFYIGNLASLATILPQLSEIVLQTIPPECALMLIRMPWFARKIGATTPATYLGKIKMAGQSMSLIYILLGLFLRRPDIIATGAIFAWCSVFLSLLSLTSHFWDEKKQPA